MRRTVPCPCVIFNPAARSGRIQSRLRQLREIIAGASLWPTQASGHATALAEEAASKGFETVVAAGGDGTINEVLNGLMRVPAARRPRLGVLPFGTASVFARELGLPLKADAAWRVITAARERIIDVGVARTADGATRYFAQLAGAGFDALAITSLNPKLKRRIGPLAYVVSSCRLLASPLPRMTVHANGDRIEGDAVLIGNGRFYGGPFTLFPTARMDDGQLAVCVFQRCRPLDVMRYLQGILRGVHTRFSDVHYVMTEKLRVESDQPAPVEVDGEAWGECPAEFSVEAGALRVLVP